MDSAALLSGRSDPYHRTLTKLDKLFLVDVYSYQPLPKGDPRGEYHPASFAGWFTVFDGNGDVVKRRRPFHAADFHLSPAARCPELGLSVHLSQKCVSTGHLVSARSTLTRLLLVLFLFNPAWQGLLAQTGPEVIDVRPYAPVQGSSFETVSQANASLSLHVPVWSLKQRGNMTLDFFLTYDSPTYDLAYDCVDGLGTAAVTPNTANARPDQQSSSSPQPQAKAPAGSCAWPACVSDPHQACNEYWDLSLDPNLGIFPWGWKKGVRFASSTDLAITLTYTVDSSGQYMTNYLWEVRTPDQGDHKTVLTLGGDWRVVDGTGWDYTPSNCTLRDSKGTRYVFACPAAQGFYANIGTMPGLLQYVEDVNGNHIALNYHNSQNNQVFDGWTDTVGRNISYLSLPITTNIPASCPQGTDSFSSWQPPDTGSQVVLCYSSVATATDLPFSASAPYVQSHSGQFQQFSATYDELGAVVLPSGDRWTFSYVPVSGEKEYGTAYKFG